MNIFHDSSIALVIGITNKQTAELVNIDDKAQLVKISRVKITCINKKVSCKISKLISKPLQSGRIEERNIVFYV